MRFMLSIFVLIATTFVVSAQTLPTGAGSVRLTKMLDGLDQPWAIGFLPGSAYLVTERGGRVLHVSDGRVQIVSGTPDVATTGQGGLLDIMVPRDFAQSREIFLSFAKKQGKGAGTAVVSGKLTADASQLTDVKLLFEAAPGATGGRHFGSRIVEAPDGTLFITLGERGDRPSAQDLSRHNGSVIRINRDGSVPSDNPFVGQAGLQPEIWSYGHRNPQGAALDLNGQLWTAEHGAKGGDEINIIRKGANYGWPVISFGSHYSGRKIGEGTTKDGMQQPVSYWDPSIAPSGMMFYSGKLWPEWRGNAFVGSLKFDYVSRLAGNGLKEVEQIKSDQTTRVRDVVEAPDGSIWFIAEDSGSIFRMTPE